MTPPSTEKYGDPAFERLSSSRAQRVAVLSWTDANGRHEETIVSPTLLGSSDKCHLVIADPSVSAAHVELSPEESGLRVRDLESTNGTYRDATRIFHDIQGDDFRLRIGRIEVSVSQPKTTVASPLWPRSFYGRMVGQSAVMRALFEQLNRIAQTDKTVMIQGETGTGKELVAEAIHEHSKRRAGPFIVVDCGSLPKHLLQSELFGHRKGAFSGATSDHVGAFEAAKGGTLFLDEIGELPLDMQSMLLRALAEHKIRRVGETKYRDIDVRVVSASLRDLRELVNRGAFRTDLYFRLAVVRARLPALRERREDIPLIVEHFLRDQPDAPRPTASQMKTLSERDWIGNVRHLRNVVENATVNGWDVALAEDLDISAIGMPGMSEPPLPSASEPPRSSQTPLPLFGEVPKGLEATSDFRAWRDRWIDYGDRYYINWLFAKFGRSISRAALEAGIDRSYLNKIIKRLGL